VHSPPPRVGELQLEFGNNRRLLFVGGCYGIRRQIVDSLFKLKVDIEPFGVGWGNGTLSIDLYDEYCRLFGATLGISFIGHSRRHVCIKGRDLEVLNSGGLYITNLRSGLSDLFPDRQVALGYSNIKQIPEIFRRATVSDTLNFEAKRAAFIESKRFSWSSLFTGLFNFLAGAKK